MPAEQTEYKPRFKWPRNGSARYALAGAALLALYALVGSGMVALTHDATRDAIAENQRHRLLHALTAVLPVELYDNDPLQDTRTIVAPEQLGSGQPLTVYRARRDGNPVAAVFTVVAPNGYGGPIRLLVGVDAQGTVLGVRVVSHHETPGLGDQIQGDRSDWIHGFDGKSLGTPVRKRWSVRHDGGVFDQFTGATITPRAVVGAVRNCLEYFRAHRATVFAQESAKRD